MYNHVALSYPGLLTPVFVSCSTNVGTHGIHNPCTWQIFPGVLTVLPDTHIKCSLVPWLQDKNLVGGTETIPKAPMGAY